MNVSHYYIRFLYQDIVVVKLQAVQNDVPYIFGVREPQR